MVLFSVVFRAGLGRVLGGASAHPWAYRRNTRLPAPPVYRQQVSFPPASGLVPLVCHLVYASAGAFGQEPSTGTLEYWVHVASPAPAGSLLYV